MNLPPLKFSWPQWVGPDGHQVRRPGLAPAPGWSPPLGVGVLRALLILLALGLTPARANTLVSGTPLPLSTAVGAPMQVGFTVAGSSVPVGYFEFTGSLPPGVTFSPAPVGNRIPSANPVVRGTPTTPGTFVVYVTAFSPVGVSSGVSHPVTLDVFAGAAASVVAPPVAQAVDPGVPAVFSAQVAGSPAPRLQWQRQPAGGFAFSDLLPGGGYSGVNTSALSVASPTLAMNGDQFRLVATNAGGTATSAPATLTVRQAPVFTNGATAVFARGLASSIAITTTGSPRPTYSVAAGDFPAWLNLDPLTGVLSGSAPADAAASYAFTVRASNGYVATQDFTLSVPPWTNRLINFSGRTTVGATGATLRFTIEWGRRTVLIRAVGPSLSRIALTGMSDPALTLSDATTGAVLATNDDWDPALGATMDAVRAFAFLPASKDAAIIATLEPGSYSALASGANGSTGACLLELYDLQFPQEFSLISYAGSFVAGSTVIGGFGITDRTSLRVVRGGNSAAGVVSYPVGLHEIPSAPTSVEVFQAPVDSRLVLPVLATAPVTLSVFAGNAGSLSATVLSGSPPFTYQWRKAGVPIPGATGATLSFLPATAADAGSYDVVVTNAVGSITSPAYTVSVPAVTPPTITSQSVGGLLALGNPARFFVQATGTQLSFQWRKDGVPIPGANGANLQFTTSSLAEAGVYDVVVANSAGSVVSVPATIHFGQLPLTAQPQNRFVRLGEPAGFAVSPGAGTVVTYNWSKGGGAIVRNTAVFAADGSAQGELTAGQLVPAGRWTIRNGGVLFGAGVGTNQTGQVAGATNESSFNLGVVGPGDLGSYAVSVTQDGLREERGTGFLTLRGYGRIGRRLFAVGAAGTILRSDDGIAWTPLVSGVATELRGVAVRGDVAVAVGAGGAILRSTDGETWTSLPQVSTVNLNAVVAGPDRFVAVGDGGRLLVSPNGEHWYLADSKTNTNLTGVTYGNGTYVFSGANGALFVSPDGFRWVNVVSTTTQAIQSLTYSGTQFWALAGTSQLLTSPDGVAWTQSPAPAQAFFRSLGFTGELLVAVGTGGRVQTSRDGVTWTPRTSGTTQALLAATWSGAELPEAVAPSAIANNLDFRIVTPPRETSATAGLPAFLTVGVSGGEHSFQWFRNGVAIAGATTSTLSFPVAGVANVASYTVTITSPAGQLTSVAARLALMGAGTLGTQFLAVGADGTILSSPDGVNFVERSLSEGVVLRAVAASAFRAVAVGRANQVAVSADGVNWTYRTLNLSGAARVLRGIAAGMHQLVAVGSAGTILVSYDHGDTWQLVEGVTTRSLWGVAWNRDRFVAVGDGGIILTSPDGLAWSTVAAPTTERLYGVAAVGAKFVAVSVGGTVLESADGLTGWQSPGSSSAFWVRAAAWATDGRRVAVGDRGLISTSRGGESWTLSGSPTSARLYGLAWTGVPGTVTGNSLAAANGPALRILTSPAPAAVTVGGTAVLSVVAGGVTPLYYQWQRDGVDVPGGSDATLVLPGVQMAQAGSYSVTVSNASGTVVSSAASLLVSAQAVGNAPVVLVPPENRTINVGGATSFAVTASGTPPISYRWLFNGNPIPGAVGSTLALSGLQWANAGGYTAVVSNPYGSATSAPALLTVTQVPGAPTITVQPVPRSAVAGTTVNFSVTATGNAPLLYQWLRDGVALAGQTANLLSLPAVTTAQSGVYTVSVTNPIGTALSDPAGLTVVPVGTAATHVQVNGLGYRAGEMVSVQNAFTFLGEAQSLGWEVLLPPGWAFVSASGNQGDIRPLTGETQVLSWAWSEPQPGPVQFTYVVRSPAGATGNQSLAALAILRQGGVPIRLLAQPDPLVLVPADSLHSADTDGNYRISLLELTRVIELYNTRNGSTRTGAYAVAAAVTEDGFAIDSARVPTAVVTLSRHHSADSNRDGKLGLLELTRVIEIYNYRSGSSRTGQYRVQLGTEDGFAPGG